MIQPRLLCYMVVRNEADRYLDACLSWAQPFVDGIAVYDDQSSDETIEVIGNRAACQARPDGVPSFIEHEGRFRQAAWDWFEDALEPTPGSWVLALDADEFLVADGDVRAAVLDTIAAAEAVGATSVVLPVPEVFAATADDRGRLVDLRVRADGFWGTIAGPRLFRWQPDGVIRDRAMGCGAEPTYVASGRIIYQAPVLLSLLHFGYCDPADRMAKFERYVSLANHGHADSHVLSIPSSPTLKPWGGPVPAVWRGTR